MRRTVALSMLDRPSATERLEGISWSAGLDNPGEKTIVALVNKLNGDPNVNVRLAAVDALYLFRINSTVPNLKSFVCSDSMLDTIFDPTEAQLARDATMSLPAFSSSDLSNKTIYCWELIGDPGTTISLALTGDEMRALMATHAIQELPADDGDLTYAQLVALVECELAGAPSGAQELEGELVKLLEETGGTRGHKHIQSHV